MHRQTFVRTLLAAAAGAFCLAGAQAQCAKLSLGPGASVGNPRHEPTATFAEVVPARSGCRIYLQGAPSVKPAGSCPLGAHGSSSAITARSLPSGLSFAIAPLVLDRR